MNKEDLFQNDHALADEFGNENGVFMTVLHCKIIYKPFFSEYLKLGWNMRLSVAIDFTGSNGDPKDKKSLHYLNPESSKLNQYEEALTTVGNIIEQYDPEKKFPTIGFGGIPYGQSEV